MLWLAESLFGHVPFPLVHIDTAFKIPEMIEYRDRLAREYKLDMIYGINEEAIKAKRPSGRRLLSYRVLQTLKDRSIEKHVGGNMEKISYEQGYGLYEIDTNTEPFTGVIVGVRADEEGSAAKSAIFTERPQQRLGHRRPASEFWNQYKTDFAPVPMFVFILYWIGRSWIFGNTYNVKGSPPFHLL